MKCKICGHRANSIKAIGAHYRKKHPAKMKHRDPKSRALHRLEHTLNPAQYQFCPKCGARLG